MVLEYRPKRMEVKLKRRVVVTGMGLITPLGNDINTFWNNIKEQKTAFKPITYFDTTEYKANLGAQVEDFDPKQYMDPKSARRMETFCQFAIAAAKQALEDSKLDLDNEDRTKIGVSIGSGIGSLQAVEREYTKLVNKGPRRVAPLLVPQMISNMAAGNVAIQFGLKGKCTNVVTACATGTHSIGEAYRYIQYNDADVMLAGGTEASITPIGVSGFGALTALSSSKDPKRASIPFDKERSGFIMGEGAGVIVLESLEHAINRGATIYAEIGGYGATCDAYHITSPSEDGEGAARAMLLAVEEAGIKPEQVDYINAHGTSTPLNDLFETRAIKMAFKDHAYKLNVNSTKSMVGHLLGAAGAVEFITCVKSIMENYIHATAGYEIVDEELDLNYTKVPETKKDVTYCISNSLGFGGHNGSVLVQKYKN